MKATSSIARITRRDGSPQTGNRPLPAIDYHYQSILLEEYRGHCANTSPPSFRNISRGYFENEARHTFIGEAAFFTLIVITAAIPILSNIHALADFIRAI